jgi:hypothetical protein
MIMKKFLVGLFVVIISTIGSSQSQSHYSKVLTNLQGASTISNVVKADSGYLLVIDHREPGQWHQNTIYLLIDEYGNVLDSALYRDTLILSSVFDGNTAIKTHNGGFIIATCRTDTGSMSYGYLVRLNSSLDTLWTRTFTHPDTLAASQPGAYIYYILTAVRQTWDGGFILAGNYNKNCGYDIRGFLIKTDSLGDMEWVKLYPSFESGFDIELTNDSGFYFPAATSTQLLAVKVDKYGAIQSSISVNSNSNPCIPLSLETGNSVVYMLSSFWYDLINNNCGITLTKINTLTNTKIWEKNYYPFLNLKSYTLHQSIDMGILSDGSIIVCGTSQVVKSGVTTGAEYKGVMMKLSADGDSLWARYYGYGDFKDACQFNDFCLTNDGGFMAVGYYSQMFPSPQNSKAWIVKMDSNGYYNVGIQQLQLSNTELQIYPNPTTDYLTLQTKDNTPLPQGKLQIINMQGALQMEQAIPKHQNQLQLNLSHLPAGLYLGRIVGSNGERGGFRFVKE